MKKIDFLRPTVILARKKDTQNVSLYLYDFGYLRRQMEHGWQIKGFVNIPRCFIKSEGEIDVEAFVFFEMLQNFSRKIGNGGAIDGLTKAYELGFYPVLDKADGAWGGVLVDFKKRWLGRCNDTETLFLSELGELLETLRKTDADRREAKIPELLETYPFFHLLTKLNKNKQKEVLRWAKAYIDADDRLTFERTEVSKMAKNLQAYFLGEGIYQVEGDLLFVSRTIELVKNC